MAAFVEKVERFKDIDGLSAKAASFVLEEAISCVGRNGVFSMALSGGNGPKGMLSALASEPFASKFPWERSHFFQVDERFAPFSNANNNFKAAFELLFSKVPVPCLNIHRMPTDTGSADFAAGSYEFMLKSFFEGRKKTRNGFPVFDLVQLGMGDDGHTASLFPGSPLLSERTLWVAGAPAPSTADPKIPRVTLSFPAINAAEKCFFIIQGESKAKIVESFLDKRGEDLRESIPASAVRPSGELLWLLCA